MSIDTDRDMVKQIIQRLERDKRGFGERRGSYYAQVGSERFVTYLLSLKSVQDLFPFEGSGDVGDLMTQEQQLRLKEIVDHADRYGELVTAWRQGRPPSEHCLLNLEQRLSFWAFRNMPDYCWEFVVLPRIVEALLAGAKAKIIAYDYQQDLLLWTLPLLIRKLREQVEEAAKQVRDDLDLAQIGKELRPVAGKILNHIRETHGIYGIEADDVTERALRLLLCAGVQEYEAHRDRLVEWATDKLRGQIKIQVPFYVDPQVGPDWYRDPEGEAWELQKRRRLLFAFCDVLQSKGVEEC